MMHAVHMHMTISIVILAFALVLLVVGVLAVFRIVGQRVYDSAAREAAQEPSPKPR